ncbi:MAG: LysR family transcriptional regulator [Burkholderiales bacterium]|nr:LysR family transcriptional regulator [Burkholderiales bacterium]
MNQRPLSLLGLRAFEAVARRLSFRAAAEELHLTQPAISRQIKALEAEVGQALFVRGTRHVALSPAGLQLQNAVLPLLAQLDGTVRLLRQQRGRQTIQLSTFASFASLWLLPRLEAFQREHPELDLRIAADDRVHELGSAGFDLALSLLMNERLGEAEPLFPETLTPVHSPRLTRAPKRPADLAQHTLAEEDAHSPTSQAAQWRPWLAAQGLGTLQPRGWLLLNFTHQQVQAALAGQAVALARLPLVQPLLARGELVESFGPARRLAIPVSYCLRVAPGAAQRPEVAQFLNWLRSEAASTREALQA